MLQLKGQQYTAIYQSH